MSAIFACVRLLSDSIAMLPCALYRKEGNKTVLADADPVNSVLSFRPNSWQTPYEFWRTAMMHVLLRGNFFAEKVLLRDRVSDLIPLNPAWMTVGVTSGGIEYTYRKPNAAAKVYPQAALLHLRGLSVDGVVGMSVLEAARNSVGVSVKAEDHAINMFKNGVCPSGVLNHPGELSEGAVARLREDFETRYSGTVNSAKPMLLEEGMKWEPMSMTADDAQFIEQRKYSVAEIARFFGVPPHAIGDVDRGTSWGSGIEQQNVAFLIHTLGPYLVNIQQTCVRDLVPRAEQSKFVIKFDTSLLKQPDFGTRQTGYQIMKRNGALSANEWRKAEGYEPIDSEDADKYSADAVAAPGHSPAEGGGQQDPGQGSQDA